MFEIHAPAGGIAQQLGAGFLVGKQNRPFVAAAGVFHKLGDEQGFARAGGPGGQDDRILEKPTATHLVEPGHAGGDAHVGRALGQAHGPQWEDADAIAAHGEGELPLHVGGAAQLKDFSGAAPPLTLQHVAQDHHVVGDKLLNAVAGNRAVFINALGGHHRGNPHFLQAGNQPEDLATHHRDRVVLLEHRGDRINRHPLGLELVDRVVDALDQARQIKTSGHVLTFRIRRGIEDEELVLLHQLLEVPAKAGGVAQDVEG